MLEGFLGRNNGDVPMTMFKYDEYGRLVPIAEPYSACVNMIYDTSGARVSHLEDSSQLQGQVSQPPSTYTYDKPSWRTPIEPFSPCVNMTYDPSGSKFAQLEDLSPFLPGMTYDPGQRLDADQPVIVPAEPTPPAN
jgi:hypothetical protein